ncbi:MAG: thioredoxin domain-containing protein [Candidatus Zixiibacteriota bacterium]
MNDRISAPAQEDLAQANSAYLRSAAHQPVHWHPWGDAAFTRARQLDRPILLDIGAVWCHWCHVMDGESYENPKTAQIINDHFIAIKVDRDEHPDVDRRYQEAVSALTGQGGWPLTAFLTPEGLVFFGGTYFPPTDHHGRRAFPDVLLAVAEYYRSHRSDARTRAESLAGALAQHRDHDRSGAISRALITQGVAQITASFDPVHGGFGGAPKFPHASAMELILAQHFFSPSPSLDHVIRRTLIRMARGGVHDQLGGGFHRYSTDAQWIVPHFEKMIYDNSELLRNYAMAGGHFGDPLFAETARGIIDFLTGVLGDSERGGFYASQDADVGLHDDGDYFTWTLDEVQAACSADEAAVLAERFDIRPHGEMRHNPAKNVLLVAADVDVIAAKSNKTDAQVQALLQSGIMKLRDARRRRPLPFVDSSVYTGWNGLAISAILLAADFLDIANAERFALRSLDRLCAGAVLPDGRVRHALGADNPSGLLEDGAFLGRAFLDAYERTGQSAYLDTARRINDDLLRRLWDGESGGFFDREPDTAAPGLLAQSRKPIQDSPTPSANAVAAELMLRLSELTGEDRYRDHAEQLLTAFAMTAGGLGIFGGSYFSTLDRFLRGPATAVVVGPAGDPRAEELWSTARRVFRPYKSLRRITTDTTAADQVPLPPEMRGMIASGQTRAYFCAGETCALPTDDPEKLAKTIATFGRSG